MTTAKFLFKVCLLGDGGVGKTTLLRRFIENKFYIDAKLTIGVDILNKTLNFGEDIECRLSIWDFGGQERFRSFQDGFIMGAHGALILFDLTAMKSAIWRIENWVKMARKADPSMPLILIGAKSDLEDRIIVSDDEALDIKEKYHFIDYLKTSAKSGLNVDKAFEELVVEMIKKEGKEFLETLKEKYAFFAKRLL